MIFVKLVHVESENPLRNAILFYTPIEKDGVFLMLRLFYFLGLMAMGYGNQKRNMEPDARHPLSVFAFPLLGLLSQDSVYRREFISGLSE